ncbi:hypothetical protein [Vallitalea guaymasensis]|uniref:hypothetical protein n=1 Tax=Vallitalea guaymasensis TaxID=1185412 RepID=UPI000DE44EE8|nr:hypothetical protein [Vallitalea guaymasensis]
MKNINLNKVVVKERLEAYTTWNAGHRYTYNEILQLPLEEVARLIYELTEKKINNLELLDTFMDCEIGDSFWEGMTIEKVVKQLANNIDEFGNIVVHYGEFQFVNVMDAKGKVYELDYVHWNSHGGCDIYKFQYKGKNFLTIESDNIQNFAWIKTITYFNCTDGTAVGSYNIACDDKVTNELLVDIMTNKELYSMG